MDMMKSPEKLFLKLRNSLPIGLSYVSYYKNIIYLKDINNHKYTLYIFNKKQSKIINSLAKSKYILKPIYIYKENNDIYYLYEDIINKSSDNSLSKDILIAFKNIFKEFSFKNELDKYQASLLQSLFKVLNNRFTSLEFRIRELELKPKKYDLEWVILSKYHTILDARIYLYDLESDIFKMIDKKETIEFGLIFKDISSNNYKNGLVEPNFDVYYGPIGMMLARYYLALNHSIKDDEFIKVFKDIDTFNKKYFLFMTLYCLIINVTLDFKITNTNTSMFLNYTHQISRIIKKFGEFAK